MALFRKQRPKDQGFIDVGEGHELFYRRYGNPKGKSVLFVHGGPGGGCKEEAYRIFNPKKFDILLVDQRGAGSSKPFASTKANTTDRLVEDFRKVLDHFGIKKTFLFGGSWGSLLSLCFAITYPNRVRGMVLRGIFLGSGEETDYLLTGGPRTHFPEVWARFVEMTPKRYWKNPARYYQKMMENKDEKIAKKFCYEWARYEVSLLKLHPKEFKPEDDRYIALAKLEAHYLLNDCFLPRDYVLKSAKKIARIPLSIVHGRYDFVTVPEAAYRLHKALPQSKLQFVIGGHSGSDEEVQKAMQKEINKMVR